MTIIHNISGPPAFETECRLCIDIRDRPQNQAKKITDSIKLGITLVLAGLLSACVIPNQEPSTDTQPIVDESIPTVRDIEEEPTAPESELDITSTLTPELLYDILLAAVANQRSQPEVALDALVRAAYMSRNTRLTSNAANLALQIGDNLQAIELSRLLLDQEPDNVSATLTLATAQIRSELIDTASETLLALVDVQTADNETILNEVANLVARQPEPARNQIRTHFNKAIVANNPMVLFTAALIASRLEEVEHFISLLDQVLVLQPDWETAAILKLIHIANHHREQLDAWADVFLNSNPNTERFRNRFGHLLLQDERLDDALEQFTEVLKLNPKSADAIFASAVIHMERKESEPAEALFLRYIANNGREDDAARIYLAEMLIEQERYREAYPLLRQVLSRQYYLDAQIMLAGIIAQQSNVDAGLSHLQSIDPENDEGAVRLILEQNRLLQQYNLQQRSFDMLSEALLERPEQPSFLYNRGLLAAQMGNIDIAEQDMRHLIGLQPENAHAYNALGYTLADQTDRYDEALTLITKALHFLPEDPYILDSMGWVQYRLGDLESALKYLEQAWEYDKNAEIAAHLGEVLWTLGRTAEAEVIWQLGKQNEPDNNTLLKTIERFLGNSADERAVWQQEFIHILCVNNYCIA